LDAGRQIVVQMHGEPGSGKSSVAQRLGPRIGAIVLDKDIVKSALLRTGVSEELAGPASYEAYHGVASSLLRQGYSVVLDNPIYWAVAQQRSLDRASEAGARYILIVCACPDRAELVRRLQHRDAMPSQPRAPLTLTEFPGAVDTAYEPRLTLDTTRPIDDLVDEAVAYVEQALAAGAAITPKRRP
jgi:predicted kinase